MSEPSNRQFNLIVAYLLPGFVGLAGIVPLFPAVADWLRPVDQREYGIGPTVYALLAATATGMIVSCFRWIIIDQLHHATGIKPPAWDDKRLADVLGGFDYLVQNHFRYYEFSANTLVAGIWAYGVNRLMKTLPILGVGTDIGMVLLTLVLFAASRDALARYYGKARQLLTGKD